MASSSPPLGPHTSNPLSTQVGGHPGVATTEDGSLLIKPALPKEVDFYQAVNSNPALAPLQDFVPEFYGTLTLQGKVTSETEAASLDASTIQPVEGVSDAEKVSLVLENLSYPFSKPNIVDIKLGMVLYDEDATPEKRARMEKVAKETTSGETGIRLVGFQVYDLTTNTPVITSKSYGKSLKPAELPQGFARVFPIAPPTPEPQHAEPSHPVTGIGLPPDLLLEILSGLRAEIEEIYQAFSQVEIRMVGGSLLLIYEADPEHAREGLRLLRECEQQVASENQSDSEGAEEESEGDGKSEEDNDDSLLSMPFVARLIDFAHTTIRPGEGPDEGVLLGLSTILRLMNGRIQEVEAILNSC